MWSVKIKCYLLLEGTHGIYQVERRNLQQVSPVKRVCLEHKITPSKEFRVHLLPEQANVLAWGPMFGCTFVGNDGLNCKNQSGVRMYSILVCSRNVQQNLWIKGIQTWKKQKYSNLPAFTRGSKGKAFRHTRTNLSLSLPCYLKETSLIGMKVSNIRHV